MDLHGSCDARDGVLRIALLYDCFVYLDILEHRVCDLQCKTGKAFMGTGVVFCSKFRFVPYAVVFLSLNGCASRHDRALVALKRTRHSTIKYRENVGNVLSSTGALVRIAHYGNMPADREACFGIIEKNLPDTHPEIDKKNPTDKEIGEQAVLLEESISNLKQEASILSKHIREVEKETIALRDDSVKYSMVKSISYSIGASVFAVLLLSFFTSKIRGNNYFDG